MKEPKQPKQPTTNDHCICSLKQRAGHGRADMALTNKNIRIAWALLTQGTE